MDDSVETARDQASVTEPGGSARTVDRSRVSTVWNHLNQQGHRRVAQRIIRIRPVLVHDPHL